MAGLSRDNPLKEVFNKKTVSTLAERILRVWPQFPRESFEEEVNMQLPELKFGARNLLIRDSLWKHLPKDYSMAISILVDALGPELANPGEAAWDSFIVMSQCAYVSKYGTADVDLSLRALYEMTKRFTAEGDLRTFLEVDYEKTMKYLHLWCEDPSPHVRRLVSEGTRPRLPLGTRIKRFQEDPGPVLELLERLHEDTSLYVRRSVANNINDIAKDNPHLAIQTLERWSREENLEVRWLVRHASRTLIKQGNSRVLGFLNFTENPRIEIGELRASPAEIRIGSSTSVSFSIESREKVNQRLVIDYVVGFVKSNRSVREKVFKYKTVVLQPDQILHCRFVHHFRDTSGRKHYPGDHSLSIQVNGKRLGKVNLTLS